MIILNEKDFLEAISELLQSIKQMESSVRRLWMFIEEGDDRLTRIEDRISKLEETK